MKLKLTQILIFLLILVLPFGRRHIFWDFSPIIGRGFSPFAQAAIFAFDIVVLGLFLAVLFKKIKISGFINPLIMGFFVWFLVDMLISPRETVYDTFLLLKTLEILLILLIFAFVSRDRANFHVMAWSFTISGLLQSIIAFSQYLAQKSVGLHFLGETIISPTLAGIAKIQMATQTLVRPYGTFDHPNQLAAFLLVACATALYLLINREKPRIFAGLALIVLTFAEFLTFSRAGIGAVLIMFAIALIYQLRKLRWGNEFSKILSWTVASIVFPIIVLLPLLDSRATISDSATLTRLEYDKIGMQIIREHPLLGVGPGNMIFAVADKLPKAPTWQIQPPHNYFIDVACETGVIGLALFLVLLIYLFSTALKKGEWLGVALLPAIVFLMMFDHYFYDLPQTQLLLWVILGIIIGIVSQETRAETSTS